MPVWLANEQFVLCAVLFLLTVVFFCRATQSRHKTKKEEQQAAPVPIPVLPITTFSRHGNLLLKVPSHLWRHVLSFNGFKEYMLAGRICTYVYDLWKKAMQNNRVTGTLFLPNNCKTLKEAVGRVHGGQDEGRLAGALAVSTNMAARAAGTAAHWRPEQPLKAEEPMLVTLPGMAAEVKPEQL